MNQEKYNIQLPSVSRKCKHNYLLGKTESSVSCSKINLIISSHHLCSSSPTEHKSIIPTNIYFIYCSKCLKSPNHEHLSFYSIGELVAHKKKFSIYTVNLRLTHSEHKKKHILPPGENNEKQKQIHIFITHAVNFLMNWITNKWNFCEQAWLHVIEIKIQHFFFQVHMQIKMATLFQYCMFSECVQHMTTRIILRYKLSAKPTKPSTIWMPLKNITSQYVNLG